MTCIQGCPSPQTFLKDITPQGVMESIQTPLNILRDVCNPIIKMCLYPLKTASLKDWAPQKFLLKLTLRRASRTAGTPV